MKKEKRIFLGIIISLIIITPAYSSGDQENADASPLKLTGWSYEVDIVNENLEIFSEQTGIATEQFLNFPSNQYHDKLVTSFVAGSEFDVVYVRDSYLAEWVTAGWIIPLDDFEGIDEIKKDISQGALDQMSYNGKLYGLPYYAGRRIMAYNSVHLTEAGFSEPPKTWDELIEQSKVIKAKGISEYPIILDLNKSENIEEIIEIFVHGRGGKLFDEKNQILFNGKNDALKQTLKYIKEYIGDLIDPASLVSTDHETARAMSAGTRTFSFVSDYNVKSMNDPASSVVPGQIKMALVPGTGTLRSGSTGLIRFYGLTTNSKNKEKAFELIKFLGHKDKNGDFLVAKKWALNFGLGFVQIPLFNDIAIKEEINKWGDTEVMQAQDEYVIPRFYRFTPWFQEWQTEAWGNYQKAIMGEKTIDEILVKLAENAEDLIQSYK